jgi:hypothetical protein
MNLSVQSIACTPCFLQASTCKWLHHLLHTRRLSSLVTVVLSSKKICSLEILLNEEKNKWLQNYYNLSHTSLIEEFCMSSDTDLKII